MRPTVFSTAGLPDARRVELWESHNATALIGLDVAAPRPLEATELNIRLARVQLARVTGSPHAVRRTAAVIDRSPADAVAVYVPVRAASAFHYPKRTLSLAPGTILVCDADRPFARDFTRGLEELVIKVPKQAIEPRPDHPAVPVPVTGADASPYARALAKLTDRATRAVPAGPADERTILDLVAVLVGGQRAACAVAHRAAARAYIEEHLTDPNLSAGEVAAAIAISERHLSRVFAADGVSVPRHILSRRLDLARVLLTGPDAGAVADIAARCGFTSAAYFSHVFRARFGQRASEARASEARASEARASEPRATEHRTSELRFSAI
jgi:AraC-like DNA-binding protein